VILFYFSVSSLIQAAILSLPCCPCSAHYQALKKKPMVKNHHFTVFSHAKQVSLLLFQNRFARKMDKIREPHKRYGGFSVLKQERKVI
jgi:hypothetical protein